jgi:glycosyltransferase involved in cell wall biosynthesis
VVTKAEFARPERILFIVNVAWFFLSHRLPLARAARAAGFDVHLLTEVTDPAQAATLQTEGITLHRARIGRGTLSPLADLRFFLCALRTIRVLQPTLVHNVTVKPVVYGTLAARLLRVPAVINALSGLGYSFTARSRWLLARSLRLAYRGLFRSRRVFVIFQNPDDQHAFTTAGIVDARRSKLIRGSGVDLSAYDPRPEDLSTTPWVVLPARMLRDKGVLEFVAAARLLRERNCPARAVLAGPLDPSNPAALSAQQMQELQSDGAVEWLGEVTDMAALYERASIVCLPSYREGLPKSLIEACAAGRAIVTTDVPGCREVVQHGINGLLVPARNPNALADALQRLLDSPGLRASYGAAGRVRAEQEFALGTVIQQTLRLYSEAMCQS